MGSGYLRRRLVHQGVSRARFG
ncbi:hypothetical protein HID58_088916 [Brassica napus]|uniref:Uncharacterized protein n=1 Tax=Brassica napus TaxID=3708 RepID=A0ABQ7Y0I1_BRANA|nr:hypothetical protein HID58_088916 [Brassica napus]